MAGVGASRAGLRAQVALVAGLRWTIFRNTLRTEQRLLELMARILLAVLIAMGAVVIGLLLGGAGYGGMNSERAWPLAAAGWAVFLCWQVAPLLMAGLMVEFDYQALLRFPLRFGSFVTLSLMYGLFDPPSLVALLWTVCVAVGVVLARPEVAPLTLAVLGAFTLANLALNRLILEWLQRVMARRRTREALMAGIVLTMLGVQLLGATAERWDGTLRPVLKTITPLGNALPPGALSRALVGAAQGDFLSCVSWTGVLAAYGAVFGLLWSRRLQRQYRGEIAEGDAARHAPLEKTFDQGWSLPGVGGTVAAVCEKELRYAIRNGQTWLSVVLPLFLIAFFAAAWRGTKDPPAILSHVPELFFPAAVAYCLLVLAPLLHNTLAFEGRGLQLLLMAPARLQDVFFAKNLVHGFLILLAALGTWATISLLVKPPSLSGVAMAFAGLGFATLTNFIVGNALSLYFPRPIEFGQLRKRASQMNVLLGLLAQAIVFGIAGSVVRETGALRSEPGRWAAAGIFLALGILAGWLHRTSLRWTARTFLERREALTAELCR